jgi:hypothetical protein
MIDLFFFLEWCLWNGRRQILPLTLIRFARLAYAGGVHVLPVHWS